MEEADVLATRVAIISKRILALGTTDYLRQKYGNVYHVHIVLKSVPTSSREEMETVEQWIERSFSGVCFDPYGNYHGQIKFSVPILHGDATQQTEDSITEIGEASWKKSGVGALLSFLEVSREAMGLQSYSVRATTMDEVFLRVIRDNNVQEEGAAVVSARRKLLSIAGWKRWH
jgi:ATP-binding cassette subfamily A (ABC1) protein 3